MEDLPGFPPGLLLSKSKEQCREVLLQVMREYVDSQWFHINDLPKPIRRVFYARIKTNDMASKPSIGEMKARASKPSIGEMKAKSTERTFVSPLTGSEIKIPMSESVDKRKMIKKSLNDVTKCLEKKKIISKDILLKASTHLFPKQGCNFIMPPGAQSLEEFKTQYDQKEKARIAMHGNKINQQYAMRAFAAAKAAKVVQPQEMDFGRLSVATLAEPNRYKQFWEDCTGRKFTGLVIPKKTNVFDDILACCKENTRMYEKNGCDIIYRRVTRCSKMFIDYCVVRKGAYQDNEFKGLFPALQMEWDKEIDCQNDCARSLF